MRLKQILIDFGFLIAVGLNHGWNCVSLSRLFLVLTAIQLITMPFTQYLWTWDHFLHGGRDFETGALMIVTFVCFALLRAQDPREEQGSLFASWWSSAVVLRRRERRRMLCGAKLPTFGPASGTPLSLCCLPLLI